MEKKLSHVDENGNPAMVDVGEKASTLRRARAQARVILGRELMSQIKDQELTLRKGPVFQTAILAGIMAAKKTSDLIPLCHPLALEDCKLTIQVEMDAVVIESEVRITGKTGVEMEALTAASVAALTIYDMCKAVSHDLVIGEIKLMEKTGGKRDFKR